MIGAKRQSVCKHIIATRLAEVLGVLKIEHAINETVVEIFMQTTKESGERGVEGANFLIDKLLSEKS